MRDVIMITRRPKVCPRFGVSQILVVPKSEVGGAGGFG